MRVEVGHTFFDTFFGTTLLMYLDKVISIVFRWVSFSSRRLILVKENADNRTQLEFLKFYFSTTTKAKIKCVFSKENVKKDKMINKKGRLHQSILYNTFAEGRITKYMHQIAFIYIVVTQ